MYPRPELTLPQKLMARKKSWLVAELIQATNEITSYRNLAAMYQLKLKEKPSDRVKGFADVVVSINAVTTECKDAIREFLAAADRVAFEARKRSRPYREQADVAHLRERFAEIERR